MFTHREAAAQLASTATATDLGRLELRYAAGPVQATTANAREPHARATRTVLHVPTPACARIAAGM